MPDLRTDLANAYWEHWRKALRDNPRDGLPAYLDRLIEVFGEHAAGPVTVKRADDLPSDAELTAWIERHPEKIAELTGRQARRAGNDLRRALGDPPLAPAAPKAPARARKPRGGTTT